MGQPGAASRVFDVLPCKLIERSRGVPRPGIVTSTVSMRAVLVFFVDLIRCIG